MRWRTRAIALVGACGIATMSIVAAAAGHPGAQPLREDDHPRSCPSGDFALSATFEVGSSWSLCWGVANSVGFNLARVTYRAPRGPAVVVLDSAALAQIDVPYDSGTEEHEDLPGFGLFTAPLAPRDCSGGQRLPKSRKPMTVCAIVEREPTRSAWYDYDFGTGTHVHAGQCLVLFSLGARDWYTYATQWSLCDDGVVRAAVGAGGKLNPHGYGDATTGSVIDGTDRYALSHYHHVFWRLDFALGAGKPSVEAYDAVRVGTRTVARTTQVRRETAYRSGPSRLWTIVAARARNADGALVAYDVDARNPDPERGLHRWTDADVYVTQAHACEQLASSNPAPCASSVDQYVNGERISDPIVWVQVSFHHVPRSEDQPTMDEHWQGFTLVPRGLTAGNELWSTP